MEQQAHGEHSIGEITPASAIAFQENTGSAWAEPVDELADPEFHWITDGADLIRATRCWIQYGLVGFTIFCILVGAVEALFGR